MLSVPQNKQRILVAPLDWGLGHTTRCIPIIWEFLQQGMEVVLAGNDVQKAVLTKEFPDCAFIHLDGYNISYSRKGSGFKWKILRQAPGILKSVQREHLWLNEIIEREKINAVISDNRYGLYNKRIPCVFVTHQLLIKNSMGNLAERALQKFNYSYINHFNALWIPDFKEPPGLAGTLSHPKKMPGIPFTYIGALSRIKQIGVLKENGHILIMLSGPEPQRSIFENMIFEELKKFNGTATVVRGKPSANTIINESPKIKIFDHLNKDQLNYEMCRAEFIICRSGYSSVMDMACISAKPILIPTPGQTEQEYLAAHLSHLNFCITDKQQNFDLQKLLAIAGTYPYHNTFIQKKNDLREAVQNFISEYLSGKK